MKVVALPLLGAVAWFYYLLPRFAQDLAVRGAGAILSAFGVRRAVVEQNLRYAFPDEPALRAELLRKGYDHLARLVFEILLLFGPQRRFVEKRAFLFGAENWQAAKARGNGVIMLSSHVGNWETMVARGALSGMDVLMVTKHLKPEWLHRAIERGRAKCGVRATYEPRTFRDVLAHLKRNGTVGFVLDQYAGPPVGVRVPVFGIPVGTQSAVALLAKRTGAAVLPTVNYRDPATGQVHVRIEKEIEWVAAEDPSEAIALNTARYAKALEAHIYAHPDEWLWTHRRFKGDLSPLQEGEWKGNRARK